VLSIEDHRKYPAGPRADRNLDTRCLLFNNALQMEDLKTFRYGALHARKDRSEYKLMISLHSSKRLTHVEPKSTICAKRTVGAIPRMSDDGFAVLINYPMGGSCTGSRTNHLQRLARIG